MKRVTDIHKKIRVYHGDLDKDPNHRYRSWEHCFNYFRSVTPAELPKQRDHAALQLGFYLASWGMYRGSSFLLQHSYAVHLDVVDSLAAPQYFPLWRSDLGSRTEDISLVPLILESATAIRKAYQRFHEPTDTLVTKVMLGTIACLPACDRYFINGFKLAGLPYSSVNAKFVKRVLEFCNDNLVDLQSEQRRIESATGICYPLMKMVDIYFWQIGYEADIRAGESATK